LLFGEIIPKIYATRRPLEIVYLMEKTHFLLQIIFKPFIYLLVKPTDKIDKALEKRNKGNISMMELSDAVDLANQDDKHISPDEQKILKGITTFRDKEVKDIMTSRPDIISIDISADFQQVLDIINKEGYSRIPVYKDSLDEVKGILYIKDLLPFINKEDYNWNEIIRSAYFVPESKKINDLFQEFKLKRIHIAVVVDEYGGTSGIISLEDVIEEIFGEIGDEFDNISSEIKFTNPKENEWIFEAKTSINDLCKLIDEDDSYFENVRGDADSLGGLFLEINQHFPNVNDKVVYKEYTLIVVSKTERKIDKIKIIKK
jgi:gliding motility-associated protein GldE